MTFLVWVVPGAEPKNNL